MAETNTYPTYPGWETMCKIGIGSFGAAYEIERKVLDKTEKAALKVITIPQDASDIDELYANGYDDASITEHFRSYLEDIIREYSMMAELKGHTNIVYCDDYRYIQHDDGFGWDIYIKMELLTPLTKIADKILSEEQALKLGLDISNALVLCRSRNIIHRDIKPENIFVSKDGDYKLGDFGIAKISERTTSGAKSGTYKYMAPEVYNNKPYGHSADIYSLGLVMYWMLNERRMPFVPLPPAVPKSSDFETARMRRFQGDKIPAPLHGSKELKRIVLKACAFEPKDRYHTAAEMREDLLALSTGVSAAKKEKVQKQNIVDEDATVSAWNHSDQSKHLKREQKEQDCIRREQERLERKERKESKKTKQKATASYYGFFAAVAVVVSVCALTIPKLLNTDNVQISGASQLDIPDVYDLSHALPDLDIGDTVLFGSYEQNGNLNDGKEQVEWIILDKMENQVLLLSKQCLDCKPYNETREDVTWENSTLRAWLNNEFFGDVFNDEEQTYVCETTLINVDNPEHGVDGGEETEDKIFILSLYEVDQYFASDLERKTDATEYAKANGVFVQEESGETWWWLRTPGYDDLHASYVYSYGAIDCGGDQVHVNVGGVRPAVWVDVSGYNGGPMPLEKRVPVSLADAEVGDSVLFGTYEQDNNSGNGEEEIEWLVLDKKDDQILIISRYCLVAESYHVDRSATTWETSTMRSFLNNTFINEAFDITQQKQILLTFISNEDNQEFGTDAGNGTSDKIFLLSADEAEQYFASDVARHAVSTDYAKFQGVFVHEENQSTWWWLRTPGYDDLHASYVYSYGAIDYGGDQVQVNVGGVRPAMWISITAASTF